MVLETDNSYSEILNKANRTTRNIAASAAVAAAVLFFLLRAVVTGAT